MEILAIVISGISALIALISALTSLYYNSKNQKQYNRSLEPSLSFKLIEYKYNLYLQVTNTGKSAAHNLKIDIIELENNGTRSKLDVDEVFKENFELYAGETTQGRIAYWGENLAEHTFPKVTLDVKYEEHITQKEIAYRRTVLFTSAYVEKVFADVNMDLNDINSNIQSLARSSLRTANYLDGFQIAPIDELNLMAGRSLHDDMMDIQKEDTKSNVVTRDMLFGQKAPKDITGKEKRKKQNKRSLKD